MHIKAVTQFVETEANETSKLSVTQRTCWLTAALQVVLLVPIVVLVLVPFVALTADAIAEPTARERLSSAPFNALGAAIGVAVWVFMFGNPAWKALRRLNWQRQLSITDTEAVVSDRSLLGNRQWSEPLRNYRGLSHHVRTTLSGTRHELILVHRNPSNCLLVAVADNIGHEQLEDFARKLGVDVLPSGVLFRSRRTARTGTATIPPLAGQAAA